MTTQLIRSYASACPASSFHVPVVFAVCVVQTTRGDSLGNPHAILAKGCECEHRADCLISSSFPYWAVRQLLISEKQCPYWPQGFMRVKRRRGKKAKHLFNTP